MARPHDGTWTPLLGSGPPISGKPFARHRSGGDSATPEAPQGLGEESLGRALLLSTPVDYFPSNFYQLSNQEGKSSGDLTFSSSPAGRQNFEWISQCLIQPSRHCCGMTWKLKTTRGLVRHQLWLSVTGRVGRYLLPSQRAGYKKRGWTAGKGPCAWWPPPDAPLDPSCPAAGPGCPQQQQQITLPGVTTTFSFAPCWTVRLNVSTSSRNALSEGKPKASAVSPFELPLQTPSSEERDTREAGYERAALCSDLPEQKRDLLQHTEVKWEAGSPAHLGSPR